jgi:hypothetical protein
LPGYCGFIFSVRLEANARDGAIIFSDLSGKLDVLRVAQIWRRCCRRKDAE